MRLVIDGRRLTSERTGVGRYLESLLEEWAQTGLPLEPAVLVLQDRGGRARVPRIESLETVVVGEGWPGLAWERWALGRVLRAEDLLFAPANLIPAVWAGRTALVVHDLIQEVLPESFRWHVRMRFGMRYRRAANRAHVILVPSDSTARDLERVYAVPRSKIRVIPPGPDPALRPRVCDDPLVCQARAALGLGRDPYFLFVGKRSKRRNLPAICAAFRAHRLRFPAHRLVFVGPRQGGAERAGPEQGIVFAGHVSEPALHGLLAGAIALLYPSLYEGFGLPVLEAMASGCPVVTLANSALVEVGGDAAIFLNDSAVDTIIGCMSQLSSDDAYRGRLIVAGVQNAARFSRARFASEVRAALQELAHAPIPSTKGETCAPAAAASACR
jgi:glycosyltransferase involved in cell wall biosynthesis